MAMVYKTYKRYLMDFKRLPNGAIYYLRSDGSGPHVKLGRSSELATTDPVTTPAGLAVAAGTRVQVVQKCNVRSQNLVV